MGVESLVEYFFRQSDLSPPLISKRGGAYHRFFAFLLCRGLRPLVAEGIVPSSPPALVWFGLVFSGGILCSRCDAGRADKAGYSGTQQ